MMQVSVLNGIYIYIYINNDIAKLYTCSALSLYINCYLCYTSYPKILTRTKVTQTRSLGCAFGGGIYMNIYIEYI